MGTKISDGSAATPALFNDRFLPVFVVTGETYGATGDGVTDDTDAIQAAITAAEAAGGGRVLLPKGTYLFSGDIEVPAFVDLLGVSKTRSVLKANADVSVKFGNQVASERGGYSGHFLINGNDLSTNPLVVGWVVNRVFKDIRVDGGLGDNIRIEGAQNCSFENLETFTSAGSGLVVDLGAANLKFYHPITNGSAVHGLKITQSGASATGFDEPRNIAFFGGMFETCDDDAILIDAGVDITFVAAQTSAKATNADNAACKIGPVQTGYALSRINLIGTQLRTTAASGPCLKLIGEGLSSAMQVSVDGGTYFRTGLYAVESDQTVRVRVGHYYTDSSINTFFNGTDSADQDTIVGQTAGQIWSFDRVTRFATGNDASPGIQGSNDTDTGIVLGSALIGFSVAGTRRAHLSSTGNLGLNTSSGFGGGNGVFAIASTSTVPSTSFADGGILYVTSGGTLTYRGPSGTTTEIGTA